MHPIHFPGVEAYEAHVHLHARSQIYAVQLHDELEALGQRIPPPRHV